MFTHSSCNQISTIRIASPKHPASPETQEGKEWHQLITGFNSQGAPSEGFGVVTKFRGLSERKGARQ